MKLQEAEKSIGRRVRVVGTKGRTPLILKSIFQKDGISYGLVEDQNPNEGWKSRNFPLSHLVLNEAK